MRKLYDPKVNAGSTTTKCTKRYGAKAYEIPGATRSWRLPPAASLEVTHTMSGALQHLREISIKGTYLIENRPLTAVNEGKSRLVHLGST